MWNCHLIQELWQLEAESAGGPALTDFLLDLRETQRTIIRRLDEIERRGDTMLAGFPERDPDSHRRYHESIIEWRELRNKIVREALVKVSSAGVLAGTAWLMYAIWAAVKTSAKQ